MVEATRQDLDKISKLIDPIHFAMMTTRGQDNLHSRPMATQKIDFDEKSLWFFTSDSSTKCSEIKKEPHVNVSFMDTKNNTYVSFVGNSEICRDKNKMKELWDSSLKSWFPKELDEPHLCLLKFNIDGLEYWDSERDTHQCFEL